MHLTERENTKMAKGMKTDTRPRTKTRNPDEELEKPRIQLKFSEIDRSDRILLITTIIIFLLAEYMAYIFSPPEVNLGDNIRIIYLHIPAAWVSYLAFGITFVSSLLYLREKSDHYDLLSVSSVELGVLFCSIAIITGSIFSNVTWGAYWNWDPRQTTTLILWFGYAAYLSLRFATKDPERRARISAVLGVLIFPTVPLSYLSTRLYYSLHPIVIAGQEGGIAMVPEMGITLLVSVVAVTFLFIYLLRITFRIERTDIHLKIKKYEEPY